MKEKKRIQQGLEIWLLCLIPLVMVIMAVWPERSGNAPIPEEEQATADSLYTAWKQQDRQTYRRHARQPKDTVAIVMQRFDPNTADSLTLLQVGLRPWQVRALMHYREKGGRLRTKESVRRLYGMTDSMYLALRPWIDLPDSAYTDSLWRDSVTALRPVSTKRDTVLELNTADTTELQYLHGIGPVLARRIVQHRNSLGGYVRLSQLADKEVGYTQWEEQTDYLTIDTTLVKKFTLEGKTAAQLQRHPYIRYEQGKAIETWQRRRGIRSLQDIRKAGIFTEEELDRLAPYLALPEKN